MQNTIYHKIYTKRGNKISLKIVLMKKQIENSIHDKVSKNMPGIINRFPNFFLKFLFLGTFSEPNKNYWALS